MFALLILLGLLIVAALVAVGFLVAFIVAAVKHRNGTLTQEDLDKATEVCRKNRAERRRRRSAGYHRLMRHLGYER